MSERVSLVRYRCAERHGNMREVVLSPVIKYPWPIDAI